MVGPVFNLGLLLNGRRGRLQLFRLCYGGFLLLQILYIYFVSWYFEGQFSRFGGVNLLGLVEWSRVHVHALLWEQFVLILLVTPGFVAGEITDEKTRGTLQYLLTCDLASWQIVLGKLLGQGAILTALLALNLPLLVFSGICGEYPLGVILAQEAVLLLLLFLIASASLLASVWCRATSDAMLSVYGGLTLLLLGVWAVASLLPAAAAPGAGLSVFQVTGAQFTTLLQSCRPTALLELAAADATPAQLGGRLLVGALVWGGLGCLCLALASWRLRPAYVRQLESGGAAREWGGASRPPVSNAPVRWREQYVEGIAPLGPLRRVPRRLGLVLVSVTTAVCLLGLHPGPATAAPWQRYRFQLGFGFAVLCVAGLIVATRSSGAISRERERQTWEALLLSRVRTIHVVRDKFCAILHAGFPYLLACGATALAFGPLYALAYLAATGLPCDGWGLVQEAVQTVVWVTGTGAFLVWVAGNGLWCSAHSTHSWRSLLGTLGLSSYGILLCTIPPTLLGAAVALVLNHLQSEAQNRNGFSLVFSIMSGFFGLLSLGFYWLALVVGRGSLRGAEEAILRAERTWRFPEGLMSSPFVLPAYRSQPPRR